MNNNDAGFRSRLETASSAKALQLAHFRAQMAHKDSPEFAQRQADRVAVGEARLIRQATAAARKKDEADRIQEQKAEAKRAEQMAEEDRLIAIELEKNQEKLAATALKAKQKAGRDAKYAARQARREARVR
jgi:hypothetical protein